MKNRFTWIVRGLIAASIGAYAALGDPLFDAWVAINSLEPNYASDFENGSAPFSEFDNEVGEPASEGHWKSRLVQQQGSRFGRESQADFGRANQRNHSTTLRAFKDSVGDKWKSTVQVLDRSRQIALGAIVSSDGWIVTKSSEIPNRTIEVRLYDNSKAEGTVKFRRNDLDLALIKIERSNLAPIQWNTSALVRVGGWLATTDIRNLPIAIGVVSVANRNVRPERAVLGVTLGSTRNGENGALVENVVEGSGADRAGVQAGDLITAIDGDALTTHSDVLTRLKGLMAGQRVDVGILRDGKTVLITAQMMDLNNSLLDPTEMEVNGDISSRSTGFRGIVQHDSVLAPHQCGGPLVDVYGNAVGLNIARAGRVSSYAIPANIAAPAIAEMLVSVNALSSPVEYSVAKTPIRTSTDQNLIDGPVTNGIAVEALKPEVVLPIKRP